MAKESLAPHLDHVMVMLPSDAYRDVLAAGFLGESFGRVRERNGVSPVGPFTSVGVAGRSTLVQFFDAGSPHKHDFTGGLVFAYETPGSIDEARNRLTASGVEVEYELGRRAEPGEPEEKAAPAYHMLWPDLGDGCPVTFTFDEAYPEFFDRLGAGRGPEGQLYRRNYLDAVLGEPHQPHHGFGDITGVTLQLRPERAKLAATALEALGCTATTGENGVTMHGPDHSVHLQARDDGEDGLLALEIALTRPEVPPATHVFGDSSTLTLLDNGTARWTFTPVRATATS